MVATDEDSPDVNSLGFIYLFLKAKGAMPLLAASLLLSSSVGCTVGVVPEILSDRYARLYHGYEGQVCYYFERDEIPKACQEGADDAQAGSAWATLVLNMLTLFFNPVVGSLSDKYGRRLIMIVTFFLSTLAPCMLVLMQVVPNASPGWYYIANSLVGSSNFLSISFAALSDSVAEESRAPSFAILLAGFYGGFSFSPSFAVVLNRFGVSVLSCVFAVAAFLCIVVFFPETLGESLVETNRESSRAVNESDPGCLACLGNTLTRPFRDSRILAREKRISLVAVASFFSAMVFSTDANLVIYYVESHLNVRENDIARMFFVMGIVGVCFQAFLLQPLVKCLGEKGLLLASFCSGTFHNLLYGIAKTKGTLYAALCLSQFTKTNFPILSSLAARGASANEQGQVQGALFAINALAAAIGPLLMQSVYDHTKDNTGPGTMFVLASCLYFAGTLVVAFIPAEYAPEPADDPTSDLEEPLIPLEADSESSD